MNLGVETESINIVNGQAYVTCNANGMDTYKVYFTIAE